MKLVRILKQGQTEAAFGFLEAGRVYAFADLLSGSNGKYSELLASSEAYLSALPASYEAALGICADIDDEARGFFSKGMICSNRVINRELLATV